MATTHQDTMSVTPITGFGNQGAAAPYKSEDITYALQPLPALGNIEVASNRLARESIMNAWNQDQFSGLEGIDPREELQRKTFIDEKGVQRKCSGFILHPIIDAELINIKRRRYQDHVLISNQYNALGIRKHTYKIALDRVADNQPVRLPAQRPSLAFVPVRITDPSTSNSQLELSRPRYAVDYQDSERSLTPLSEPEEEELDKGNDGKRDKDIEQVERDELEEDMDAEDEDDVDGMEVDYDVLDRTDNQSDEDLANADDSSSDNGQEDDSSEYAEVVKFLNDETRKVCAPQTECKFSI
jgi:hypothetical protein